MDASRSALLDRVQRRLSHVGLGANLCGATDLFLFGAILLPAKLPEEDRAELLIVNGAVLVPFMVLTLLLGKRWSRRESEKMRPWLAAGREPTPAERDHALRIPLIDARISVSFWLLSALVFTALNAVVAPEIAGVVPVVILLGAITVATVNYLLAERAVRPIVACALASGLPERPAGPGVRGRVTMVWLGATGMPLLGITAVAFGGLLGDEVDRTALAGAVLFLAVVALVIGLYATTVAARSLAEPLAGVRDALERVERGDLSAAVPVDDGSELGLVEAGFNRMAAGLRERERLHDLFGRHVGRDVAKAALAGEVRLGGEVRDVGVLFVDVIGSTTLAEQLPPERVVTLLNEFFALVVAVTEAHGGSVNKFEGAGAVCAFGAPVSLDDPAGSALAAAREMRARLLDELPQMDAAVGVSAGPAVAGNVGAEARFEYTVIGDPVNEAARLCELAKQRPERVIAADAAVERAAPREAARWAFGDATVLRGREMPTRIATFG